VDASARVDNAPPKTTTPFGLSEGFAKAQNGGSVDGGTGDGGAEGMETGKSAALAAKVESTDIAMLATATRTRDAMSQPAQTVIQHTQYQSHQNRF
jgi:hypothetical protein